MGAEFARIDEEEPQAPPIPLFDQLKPPPLPVAATPLLGRDDALHQLCSVLTNPDVWLVTLTGPGGIGKTRLALSAAAHVQQPVAF
ncbi:MAG: hypothetical protein KC438_09735, partial [Thermomicrobiales bacterium]|nr:hypothetical protein [Thermomicrobiales bacterium]